MLFNRLKEIPNYLLYGLILGLRPLLGSDAKCKFTISCTPYALKTLREENFLRAIILIIKRIVSCKPF